MLLSEIKNINQLILNISRLGYKRSSDEFEGKYETPNTWGFVDGYCCKPNEVYVWINPKKNLPRWTILVYVRDDDPEKRIIRWELQKYDGWEIDLCELETIPILPVNLESVELENIENLLIDVVEDYLGLR